MTARQWLRQLMLDNYTVDNLVNVDPVEFEWHIVSLPGQRDDTLRDLEHQREASRVFQWGHNHDFGTFYMSGKMQDRHIDLLTACVDELGMPKDLSGKAVLDVGCWTGGVSLLLAAMGASNVLAIDEVTRYAETLVYMSHSFDRLPALDASAKSLYYLPPVFPFYDSRPITYDYVCFFGVLYHVTDPILALRIAFNCLKDGGTLFLETSILEYTDVTYTCQYRGPNSRTPWTWFVPSVFALEQMLRDAGFESITVLFLSDRRALVRCERVEYRGMLRAGLSRPDV